LTIGQTPRNDILDEIRPILGSGVSILEMGALDGLSDEALQSYRAKSVEEVLVTRLSDGTEMAVAKEFLTQRLQSCICDLEAAGVEVITLLCTSAFPQLTATRPLLMPDRLLKHVAFGVLETGNLAVIVPCSQQIPKARQKWKRPGVSLTVHALSPYGTPESEVAAVAQAGSTRSSSRSRSAATWPR